VAIVYIHRRCDIKDNFKNVFYVGIGKSKKRAGQTTHSRNEYWKNIYNKYDCITEITHKNITWEEACSIEKYLISFYGRKDLKSGNLCNMTDGGDGVLFWSESLRKKHSIIQKKAQGTTETRKKHSDNAKNKFKDEDEKREYMMNLSELARTPNGRLANSIAKKEYFLKNGLEKHIDIMKKTHGTPEARKRNSERIKKYFENTDARKRMSDIKKISWELKSDEYKESFRKKMVEVNKKRWEKLKEIKNKQYENLSSNK
jgi:hypothetical protein